MIFMAKLIDITGKALSGEWGLDDENGSGIPVLRTTNFTNEGIVNYDNVVTRKISKKNISEKFLKNGDILIEKSGGSDKFPVGRVIYYDGENDKYLFNNFTGLLRIKNVTTWYPKYVFYSLFANYKRGGTRCFENKTTGLHNLKTDDYVQRYEIAELSIEKQIRICDNLDKIHSIIISQKKEMDYLDELVKARFVEMFGNPVSNKKGWATEPMYQVAPIVSYEGNIDNEVWLLNLDMVEAQTGRIIEYIIVSKNKLGSSICQFDTSNVLYSKLRPYLNKVVIPDRCGCATSEMLPLQPVQEKLNRTYFAYMLRDNEFVSMIKEKVSGAKMPRVSMDELKNFKVPLPKLKMQNEFADFVRQIAKSKAVIEKSLKELETLQASLMQKYFS